MEPRHPGNSKMPDFDQLNDRIIAENSAGPHLVIKTNLDPKSATENNPYYHSEETKDPKKFSNYFEE